MQSSEEQHKLSFMYQMAGIYTALPCIVVSVDDLEKQMISVQPSISKLYKDGKVVDQPVISGVPLVFPASSTSSFTFPVRVGDTVLCIFSQRGIDNFRSGTGYPSVPTDFRKFSIRDAIAIPGLFPFGKAINQPAKHNLAHSPYDTVVAHNLGTGGEVEIRWKENGDLVLTTPTKMIINCQEAQVNATTSATVTTPQLTVAADNTIWNGNMAFVGNITHNGQLVNTGGIISNGKILDNHIHSGVQSGPNNSGPPA